MRLTAAVRSYWAPATILAALLLVMSGCSGDDGKGELPSQSALSQEIIDRGVIRIGVIDTRQHPFFSDQDSAYEGFEPALAAAITDRIFEDVDVEFEPIAKAELLSVLENGQVDIVIGITVNTEAQDGGILFSSNYYLDGIALVTENPQISTVEDVDGRKIATPSPTRAEAMLATYLEGAQIAADIETYEPDVSSDVLDETDADIVLTAWSTAQSWINERPNLKVIDFQSSDPVAIAFAPDDSEFRDEVEDGLQAVIADGSYGQLYREWFGSEQPWDNEFMVAARPIDSEWDIVGDCGE